MIDRTSERAAEKSSYEGMSDRAPVVDMAKDEPDMRWLATLPSKFELSCDGVVYLRSRIGTASSVV